MTLQWTAPKPAPDPFAAAVGDRFKYQVHFASSAATSDDDLRDDLQATLFKALPLLYDASGPRAKELLILWDAAFCQLTVVATDESLMTDYQVVTKCSFEALEVAELHNLPDDDGDGSAFDRASERISKKVKVMVIALLADVDLSKIPDGMSVLFSDEDRASVGASNFVAETLVPARVASDDPV